MPRKPVGTKPPLVSGPAKLQIGRWTVEPALNQLSADGDTVRLEPKAMAVLVYLAERPGQVVSRDALLSTVWSGLVVTDESLTQVVIKLRKALGDVAENPAYIQTISKGGYRLIAPVTRTAETTRTHRIAWLAAAGLGALLLAVAGISWIGSERAESVAAIPARIANDEGARAAQPLVIVKLFEALSNDPRAELLARGITADLVTDLSKVPGLSVSDHAPAQGQAESALPASAAPAHYVVSGSVQLVGRRIRLHVHLADGKSGRKLWSERFDRTLRDLFAVQEELGPNILNMLPAKISEAELQRVAQRYTRDLEAYEHFLRGQAALAVRRRAENETAREMFRQAIARDPAFARAYGSLALTYCADYRNQWTNDGSGALERALELAQTAIEINPDTPEIYWVQAFVHMERRQHEKALQYMETAVRLYPSYADGYALMGSITTYLGHPAESVQLLRTALRLNPLASQLYFLNLGRAYLFLGDLEQARVNLEEAMLRNPVNLEAHVYKAVLELMAGDRTAAAWTATNIRTLQPGFSGRGWMETYPMTDTEQRAKIVSALGELGL